MRDPLRQHSLYVIQAASGPVKVGIAADPQARLAVLQSSHFDELRLVRVIHIPEGKAVAKAVEAESHALLADHHVAREWFSASPEEAVRAIETALVRRRSARGIVLVEDQFSLVPAGPLTGESLCLVRERAGWSVAELSSRSRVTAQTIRRCEAFGPAVMRFRRMTTPAALIQGFATAGIALSPGVPDARGITLDVPAPVAAHTAVDLPRENERARLLPLAA